MEEEEEYEDLDISWTNQELDKREPVDEIKIVFVYINRDHSIEKVDYEFEPVCQSRIPTDRILRLVQEKRHFSDKKYRLNDILLYHLPMEYAALSDFLQNENAGGFQSIPVFHDIVVDPALIIFHDISVLYFFLYESTKYDKSSPPSHDNRITKKVRGAAPYIMHKKKSIKRYLKRAKGKGTLKQSPLPSLPPRMGGTDS